MFTPYEKVLMRILKCDINSLEMINKVKYDLDDVMDVMYENEKEMSLKGFMEAVAQMGAEELGYVYNLTKEAIESAILENLVMNSHELEEDEIEELEEHLDLIRSDQLHPEKQFEVYYYGEELNFSLRHVDFYIQHLDIIIEGVHEKMGFEFEE